MPASVGFITLFGVAVLNGVVMVAYFNLLGVLTALIFFGLLARHHLPAWQRVKGQGKPRHAHSEKHP